MEVNCSPALSMDGPVDTQVKVPLLKDTFQVVTLHTRTFNTVAVRVASSGRSPSVSVSKVSSSSIGANPNCSARVAATDFHKGSRSVSAPRLAHNASNLEPYTRSQPSNHLHLSHCRRCHFSFDRFNHAILFQFF